MVRSTLDIVQFSTPVGQATAALRDHVVVACGLGDVSAALPRFESQFPEATFRRGRSAGLEDAARAWSDGGEDALAQFPIATGGEGFAAAVWAAIRTIPRGDTVSYAELAALAGSPRAARAAGTACRNNPIWLLVPCHRVVATRGLGGYAGGEEVKRALLAHEGVDVAAL